MTPPRPEPPPLPTPGYSPQQIKQIQDAVLLGGRYRVYPWCFSIVILSFLRSSKIIFVPAGKDGAGHAFRHLALSLVVGPWGIPFGLIFTFWCVVRNLMGGKDVTREVLSQLMGNSQAEAIMRESRPAPARWGLWTMRAVPLIAIGLMAVLIGSLGRSAAREAAEDVGSETPFGRVMALSRREVSGSDAACDQLARVLAGEQTDLLRSSLMSEPALPAAVLVRVERAAHGVVIAISCPELNKFSDAGKRDFALAGWKAAAALMKDPKGRHEAKVLLTVLHDGTDRHALLGRMDEGDPRALSQRRMVVEVDRLLNESQPPEGAADGRGRSLATPSATEAGEEAPASSNLRSPQ